MCSSDLDEGKDWLLEIAFFPRDSLVGTNMFSDDDSLPVDWPPRLTYQAFNAGMKKLGRIIPTAAWPKSLLEEYRFVDV